MVAVSGVVIAGAAGFAGVPGRAAAAVRTPGPATSWIVDASANRNGSLNEISSISCTSATFCVAVGNYEPGLPRAQVLVEMWDGASWSISPAPNPNGFDDVLTGVACVSTVDCVAVGDVEQSQVNAFAEIWNGTTWSLATVPPPTILAPDSLSSVSCASATFCTAVGWYSTSTAVNLPMAQTWDGQTWTNAPVATAGTLGLFNSVSCASATSCFAVGYDVAGAAQPLIDAWNGSVWSVSSGDPSLSSGGLLGVSCATASACMAVGGTGTQAISEVWDGAGWTLTPSSGTSSLPTISCWTPSSCFAFAATSSGPESEQWNGAAWSQIAMSKQESTDIINSIACTGSGICMAGGYAQNQSAATDDILAESWSGTAWSISPAVDFNFANNNLGDVSCPASGSCVAVGGGFGTNGVDNPVWETSISGSWAMMASPALPNNDTSLAGVSCITATSCMAVGYTGDAPERPFSEELSGTTWTTPIVVPQGDGGTGNPLTGVSCASASNCVAVGYDTTGSGQQTIVEGWNGSAWTLVPSPNPQGGSVLSGVSCATDSTCVAVGSTQNDTGGTATLIEALEAGTWTVVPSPNQTNGPADTDELEGVACTGVTACTAVGWYDGASGKPQTLIETWNGGAWSIAPSPDPGPADNTLNSVSCVSTSSCVAVGEAANTVGTEQTLVEGWDGFAWTVLASPDSGTGANALVGVSCFTSAACTAVGSWEEAGIDQTLVESGGGATPTATTFDDSSPSVTYDTWSSVKDASANGGTYATSGTKTAKATFTFSGGQVSWVTREGPDQGIANVTIDGAKQPSVNLYARKAQSLTKTYSGLAAGGHTIVIAVTGGKATASTGTNVAVDAFVVGGTTVQEYSSSVSYDSWREVSLSAAFDGSYRVNQKDGTCAIFVFTGTNVEWVTATGPSFGTAAVTIDGVDEGTVDLYAAKTHRRVGESYTGLAPGTHVLVIAPTGSKDPLAVGGGVVVDGFAVDS